MMTEYFFHKMYKWMHPKTAPEEISQKEFEELLKTVKAEIISKIFIQTKEQGLEVISS